MTNRAPFEPLIPYVPGSIVRPKYSPSAIVSHRKCPRQRAFKRWSGLPRIGNRYLSFGIDLDNIASHWLLTGEPPATHTDPGDLFIHGIPFLPPAGVAAVQVPCSIDLDGVELAGYLDWVAPDPSPMLLAAMGAPPEVPVWFGDNKAYADPAKWGLTPETLATDPQGMIYAQWVLEEFDTDATVARWLYYNKRAPTKTAPVDLAFYHDANRVRLRTLIPDLDSMRAIDDTIRTRGDLALINQVPNEPGACESCGRGCDYAEHCNIFNQGSHSMAETIKERIERMKSEAAARAAGGAVVPTTINAPEQAAALVATQAEVAGAPGPAAAVVPAPTPAAAAPTKGKPGPKPKVQAAAPAGVAAADVVAAVAGESPALGRLLAGEPVTLSCTFTLR